MTEKDRAIEPRERAVCRLCGARYWRDNGHHCRYEYWGDWDEGERLYDCTYDELMELFTSESDRNHPEKRKKGGAE